MVIFYLHSSKRISQIVLLCVKLREKLKSNLKLYQLSQLICCIFQCTLHFFWKPVQRLETAAFIGPALIYCASRYLIMKVTKIAEL